MGPDQNAVDVSTSSNMHSLINMTAQLLIIFGSILSASYWFGIFIIPFLVTFWHLKTYFMPAFRDSTRILSAKRAPISNTIAESMEGLKLIRAYKSQDHFVQSTQNLMDSSQRAFYSVVSVSRWLFVQVNLLAGFLSGVVAILAVVTPITDPALAGVAFLNGLQILNYLSSYLRIYGFLETSMVGLERIMQYDAVEEEASLHGDYPLHEDWPQNGAIEFKNYSTTYGKESEPVLKNLNVFVKPGEKVAIVGRTGAGKSSITMALFRIIESLKGSIIIDDVEISKLGLADLRSRLTILPQEPVIFAGTVRENLDPDNKFSDAQIWQALKASQLEDTIKAMELQLEAELSSGGSLSVGQAQLFCLARAILRNTKILILDEATANVDQTTDTLVQEAIRREFSNCTVITIAHRIATIMDYDKVLVLDHGEIQEFDSPTNLLQNSESAFYSLAKASKLI
jgi:ABC-type multidrug transport system fused ATPase/permease subunit